jgi:hypothetical protein
MVTTLLINVHVATWLPFYGNGVPIHQSKGVNSYPQLGGKPLRGLPYGGSLDWNPLGGPPPNPHVGFYGC